MIATVVILAVLAAVSIGLNGILYAALLRRKSNPQLAADAKELLADILKGGALVHVTRIAPEDVFLRSPKRG